MDLADIDGLLVGVVLVVYGVFRLLRRYVFLEKRCTTQVAGTILNVKITGKDDRDKWGAKLYFIRYKYLVDGVEYEKKRMISKGQYKAIGKHDDFTVIYDSLEPKRHYVSEIKFRLILTLSLIVIGAILIWVW